jgi:HEAT repeat protein
MIKRLLLIALLFLSILCIAAGSRDNAFYNGMKKMSTNELIRILESDEDALARYHAAAILGRRGDKTAFEPLLHSLKQDPHPAIRAESADSLAKLSDPRVISALLKALSDPHEKVRYTVVKNLERFPGKQTTSALVRILSGEKEWEIRSMSAEILGIVGDGGVTDPLIQSLMNDPHDDVRYRATQALGKLGGDRSIDALIECLTGDDYAHVRTSAAGALGALANPQAVKPLMDTLEYAKDDDLRYSAAEALGKIGDPFAVDLLVSVLKQDPNADVRASAAVALGRTGDVRAVEHLIDAFKDNERSVDVKAETAVVTIGQDAVENLMAALKDSEPWVRNHAAAALGKINDPRAISKLIQMMQDSRESCEALVQIGAPAVLPLIEVLNDQDRFIPAIYTLVRIGKPAVEPLVAALRDSSQVLRVRAAVALGDIRLDAVREIISRWVDEIKQKSEPYKGIDTEKVNALYLPLGAWLKEDTFKINNTSLLPIYTKQDIEEKRPLYILLIHFSQKDRTEASGRLTFDCIPAFSTQDVMPSWCNASSQIDRIPSDERLFYNRIYDVRISLGTIPIFDSN